MCTFRNIWLTDWSVCEFQYISRDACPVGNFQIEYGIRFYGYQEEAGDCSYASIDVSNEIAAVSTLTFTFKTKQESGVLLYSESDVRKMLLKEYRVHVFKVVSG